MNPTLRGAIVIIVCSLVGTLVNKLFGLAGVGAATGLAVSIYEVWVLPNHNPDHNS